MNHWNGPSELERDAPATQSPFVVRVDRRGNIAGQGGVPVGDQDVGDDVLLVGTFSSQSIWVEAVEEIAGQKFNWRDVDPNWEHPLAAALAVAQWHRSTPVCENCHGATAPVDRRAPRCCSQCGALTFARTDPAVIVAVIDPQDRLLLARQGTWEAHRYSVLAGFVEPGESLEQACFREIKEESDVDVTAVAYVASQPWPMPRSLMAGFVASTSQTVVRVDGEELVTGGFFTRDEVLAKQSDGSMVLPSRASLGRLLISRWLAGDLPRP